jgi:hypothetical protein
MQFLAEKHLAVARLLRKKAWHGSAEDRVRFVRMSNSFVVCVRLWAANRGGICLDSFDWLSLNPDWTSVEQQIACLSLPLIASPPLAPTYGQS